MKWIVTFFLIFLCTLTASFFWKEKLDFDKKINDDKIGNYFTAFSSVAAAISIFFLYRQLNEMQEDRKAANLPDLYPAYARFMVRDTGSNWLEADPRPGVSAHRLEDSGVIENKRAYVELCNIGLGAAKNITIKWIYSSDDVFNIIINTYHSYDPGKNEMEHIDFIQADGRINIRPPFHYLSCCGQQVNNDVLDIIEMEDSKQKPSLQFGLKYQDIYNNWHEKIFKVTVEAFQDIVDFKFLAV